MFGRGETMSKATSKSRKIDMRVVHRARGTELSHTECARAPTPTKAVSDRAKLLRTNKCVLDHYLMEDITIEAAEKTAIFGLQFAGKLDTQVCVLPWCQSAFNYILH
jgi:hypothetical protein